MLKSLIVGMLCLGLAPTAFARTEMEVPAEPVVADASSLQNATVAVADWAGVLQLPLVMDRREDGGVWFQVLEAPLAHQDLIGRRVWLKWDERDPERSAKYRARFIDVQFCSEANKQLTQLPPPVLRTRVDGWRKVSPLESLAASHAVDDVVASFSAEEINIAEDASLQAITEPVVVSGPRESVVRFKSKISDTEFVVETVSASPQEFKVSLALRAEQVLPNFEQIKTDKFLESPHNKRGWIIQGFVEGDHFNTFAASPYELYTVDRAEFTNFSDGKDFLKNHVWDLSLPNGSIQKQAMGAESLSLKEGAEFLLLHAYGYYDNLGTIFGMSRGHVSLGWAKVVRNAITGELIIKPGNWQIYYNSPQGVMTCKYDEVSYNGDFLRGKGFYRPISDIFVPISALNGPNRVWDTYAKSFVEDTMMDYFAKTRVGYGGGYIMETLITSCVHDSANILIKTVKRVLGAIGKDDPSYRLYDKARSSLGPYVEIPESYRTCGEVKRWHGLIRGIQNGQSVIPRRFHDAAIKGFLEGGAPMINVKSNMITQEGTSLHPTAPYPIVLGKAIMKVLTLPFAHHGN